MIFSGFFKKSSIDDGVKQYLGTAGAVLLDVRTPAEYAAGHIEGSVNLPLDELERAEDIIADKSTPVFVYCRSGARSGRAEAYMKERGYTAVKNIGGIIYYHGKAVKN